MTASSSIFFCGDVHGRFDHVIRAVCQHRPAAIVLLGDIQAPQPLEQVLASILDLTEVWFIHGNHDTDSPTDHDNLFGSALAERNLHGRVAEVAGVRIAGLGGIFRWQIWAPPGGWNFESPEAFSAALSPDRPWREDILRLHKSSIFPEHYFALAGQRADILVSHEAPSAHPNGFDALDELTRSLGAGRSFHGHQHDCLDYREHRARLGFSAFGVGYRGISDQDGRVIVPGQLDDHRAYRQDAMRHG